MILLLGRGDAAEVHRYEMTSTSDAGQPVLLQGTSEVFAPVGFAQEAVFRAATLVISSTVGVDAEVVPILEGLLLDGQGGRPDSRVPFTVATPAAGERTVVRIRVGFSRPLVVNGATVGRVGLRGAWLQMLVRSLTEPVLPLGESVVDLRFDGVEVEWEPVRDRQQVVNA